MSESKRTQIYLPKSTYSELRSLARRREESVAFLVREAVDKYLQEQDPSKLRDADPVWDFIATCDGHQEDGAARHDEYLYGKDHPTRTRRPRKGLRR
ncbi:MAG: ribbon-helix-helix protein, CopG family [Candidatus Wallbacteria bacterium]|nr:ribbon-helix-helix protein, CopG family [Candidatus Wallbacteria bacterium]